MLAVLTWAALAVSAQGRDRAVALVELRVELYSASVVALEYDADTDTVVAMGISTGPGAVVQSAEFAPGEAVAWAWGFEAPAADDTALAVSW